jgi:signal transduction histidine kinase
MKLLNITTKYFLISFLIILLFWGIAFYFIIKGIIFHDVDELLVHRKNQILEAVQGNPKLVEQKLFTQTDYTIEKIPAGQAEGLPEHYENIFRQDPVEDELEPYRQLVTTFSTKEGVFKLSIRTTLVGSRELVKIILLNVFLLFFVLFVFVVYLNRKLLQKLWRPFYATLHQVNTYRLEQSQPIKFSKTQISEFKELNETIDRLIKNNLLSFQNQKRFTENASHEIQTPLAIACNKAELLMQNPDLTEEQAELVHAITENLSRLSRLNKSLLLLSKIQNNQFQETENIDVQAVLKKLFVDLKELMAFKNISLEMTIAGNVVVNMNPDLAEILFGNLVRNAIRHNIENGMVRVNVKKTKSALITPACPLTAILNRSFNGSIKIPIIRTLLVLVFPL